MKFIAVAILVISNIAAISSQDADPLSAAWEITRAANNVNAAVEQFRVELKADQPDCFDNDLNYIKCLTFPEELMESAFVAHKEVPPGTTLQFMKDSKNPGFPKGRTNVMATRAALSPNGCTDGDKFGLAVYPWGSPEGPIATMSVAKDFYAVDGKRYYCTSGPIGVAPVDAVTPYLPQDIGKGEPDLE